MLLKNICFPNTYFMIYLYLYLSDFFSVYNIKISNLANKQNAITVLNVYQFLAGIAVKELNRLRS